MLVSIIVPVYNSERFLEQCIESILNQTYREIEVIIIDDASTDSSVQICRNIASRDSRVRLLKCSCNQGPMNARIMGINASFGELLAFCDSDDIMPKESIMSLVNNYQKKRAAMIVGKHAQMYGKRVILNKGRLEKKEYSSLELLELQIDDGTLSGALISNMCGKLFEKKIIMLFIKDFPGYLRVNEDTVFSTYFLLHSDVIRVIEDNTHIQRIWKKNKKDNRYNYGIRDSANQELYKLREKWNDIENFDLQMNRRNITLSFWDCNEASIHEKSVKRAYIFIREKMSVIDSDFCKANMDYEKMRKYKKFFLDRMCKRQALSFLFFSRYVASSVRKVIPR